MKKVLFLFSIISVLFSYSCGDGGEANADPTNSDEFANMDEFMMDEFGLPLKLLVPNEDMARGKPELFYDETLGFYKLLVGPKYNVQIFDGMEADVASVKAEVENHNFYSKYEYVTDEPGLLLYSQSLPDDSRTFYHFYAYMDIGGVNYIFRNEPNGEFTKLAIEKMVKSIRTLTASTAS